MDPVIVVAVVTAVGGIFVAIIQNRKAQVQLDRIESNQDKQQELLREHHRDIGVLKQKVGI